MQNYRHGARSARTSRFYSRFIFILFSLVSSWTMSFAQEDPFVDEVWQNREVIEKTILPTVLIDNQRNTFGSGVIIASEPLEEEVGFRNLVLTAYHVVRNSLKEYMNRSHDLNSSAKIMIETRNHQGYRDNQFEASPLHSKSFLEVVRRERGALARSAANFSTIKLAWHQLGQRNDLAILEFKSDRPMKYIAKIPRPLFLERIGLTTPIRLVGYPLGRGPHSTFGEMGVVTVEGGYPYRLVSTHGIPGNSGGSVFTQKGHYLVGIFSKLIQTGSFSKTQVPGGLIIEMRQIHDYLAAGGLERLIPGYQSPRLEEQPQLISQKEKKLP